VPMRKKEARQVRVVDRMDERCMAVEAGMARWRWVEGRVS